MGWAPDSGSEFTDRRGPELLLRAYMGETCRSAFPQETSSSSATESISRLLSASRHTPQSTCRFLVGGAARITLRLLNTSRILQASFHHVICNNTHAFLLLLRHSLRP